MKLFYIQAKINLTDYAHCIVAAKGKKKAIELVEDTDQIIGVDDNFFTVENTKDLDILYHDHPREELLRVIYDRKIVAPTEAELEAAL